MKVSSEEESTDLLVFADRSKRPITRKLTGRHNAFTLFLKDPNCEVCELTRTTGAPCRNRPEAGGCCTRHPPKFSNARTADHQFLNEERESRLHHRYAVLAQDLYSHLISLPLYEEQHCAGNNDNFGKVLAVRSETRYPSIRYFAEHCSFL